MKTVHALQIRLILVVCNESVNWLHNVTCPTHLRYTIYSKCSHFHIPQNKCFEHFHHKLRGNDQTYITDILRRKVAGIPKPSLFAYVKGSMFSTRSEWLVLHNYLAHGNYLSEVGFLSFSNSRSVSQNWCGAALKLKKAYKAVSSFYAQASIPCVTWTRLGSNFLVSGERLQQVPSNLLTRLLQTLASPGKGDPRNKRGWTFLERNWQSILGCNGRHSEEHLCCRKDATAQTSAPGLFESKMYNKSRGLLPCYK
jgi:hypothetical protein